jgi:hypothetical protein
MADEPTKTKPNGLPEKIGTAFGFAVIVVVFTGNIRGFSRSAMSNLLDRIA